MTISTEQVELELADAFFAELRALHVRLDWPSYASSRIELKVELSEGKGKFSIEVDAGPSYGGRQYVKGSSLGPVMDELYRRFNYQDRADAQIESSLQALTDQTKEEVESTQSTAAAGDIPF